MPPRGRTLGNCKASFFPSVKCCQGEGQRQETNTPQTPRLFQLSARVAANSRCYSKTEGHRQCICKP